MKRFVVLAWVVISGCRVSTPASDAGTMETLDAGPRCETASRGPARRLNRAEYDATVLAVLLDPSAPARKFPPDEEPAGFDTDTSAQSVSPLLAERYFDAAEKLAATAVLPKCDASSDGCAQQLLEGVGRGLFRRPLNAEERARMLALFAKVKLAESAEDAQRTVLSAMLQSPQFLYRDAEDTGPYRLASRLSYFLTGAAPDVVLLEAAAMAG